MSDDSSFALLLMGPAGGAGLYWLLYRYYRNTDKSQAFERETKVDAKPVTGNDRKIGTNNGTRDSSIAGDNRSNYRERVRRIHRESVSGTPPPAQKDS